MYLHSSIHKERQNFSFWGWTPEPSDRNNLCIHCKKEIVWIYFSHKLSLMENYFYIFKLSTLKYFTFRNAFNQFKYKRLMTS